uniref:PsaB n=1 Tax=Arundo donax TaxID=35708 RepID=A0A0A9A4K2_ARUDO
MPNDFKISLPSYMKQISRCPLKDYC